MVQNLHAHSVFCDGKNTPEEMIRACLAAGMDSAGISIHSPLPFANGWAAKAMWAIRWYLSLIHI